MGCDGGTIPTRDELVKTKKKPEQKDKDAERLYQWQHCHLTQEALKKPIVACQLGRLYNKEAVIETLLDKTSEKPAGISHIKNLKDITELDLTPNPSYDAKNPSVGDNYVDKFVAPWICPITGLEMNGKFKFVYDLSNGKVISERAHKMLKDDDTSRIKEEHLVILNPLGDEADLMLSKMEQRKARAKAEKKAKKEGKRKNESPEENGVSTSEKKSKQDVKSHAKKPSPPPSSSSSSSSTSSLKKGGSVQNDPTKSEVFKSLFSSHESAKNRPKGNWVTFDPRYN